jgi:hypothetical protein
MKPKAVKTTKKVVTPKMAVKKVSYSKKPMGKRGC